MDTEKYLIEVDARGSGISGNQCTEKTFRGRLYNEDKERDFSPRDLVEGFRQIISREELHNVEVREMPCLGGCMWGPRFNVKKISIGSDPETTAYGVGKRDYDGPEEDVLKKGITKCGYLEIRDASMLESLRAAIPV